MMTNDQHQPDASEPHLAPPPEPPPMPVTRLISRPSVEVIDGRLVAVLALIDRAA